MEKQRGSLSDPVVKTRARKAGERLSAELGALAPELGAGILPWIRELARGGDIDDYFCTGWGYPLLEVPCWMAVAFGVDAEDRFLDDVVYSSVCGYYFIRLVDDVVDEGSKKATRLLPATAFLHERFQTAYQAYFPPDHGFWRRFRQNWALSAESTYRDLSLKSVDLDAFLTISARKTAAAVIPTLAVCEHLGRPDRIEDCVELCAQLGRIVQMADDLLDWAADAGRAAGRTPSFLLSEAEARRSAEESAPSWLRREGISWAMRLCEQWAAKAGALPLVLEVAPLGPMIEKRLSRLRENSKNLQEMMEVIVSLEAYLPTRGE